MPEPIKPIKPSETGEPQTFHPLNHQTIDHRTIEAAYIFGCAGAQAKIQEWDRLSKKMRRSLMRGAA